MRTLSLPRQHQQLPQTHFLRTSKHRQVGQYMLPHEPIPGHDARSPESCTSRKLTDMKQMCAVRWEKNALGLLLPSAFAVCWSEPWECWQRCAGLLRWEALKVGYRNACVALCVCQCGQVCVWICSLQKNKTKKSCWVYFYLLAFRLMPLDRVRKLWK